MTLYTAHRKQYVCWTSWDCIQHTENSMYAGPHDIVYTTHRKQSLCWTSWHCIQHTENSMYAGPHDIVYNTPKTVCMLDLMTLYTTLRKQYVCWTSWHCVQHTENSLYAVPHDIVYNTPKTVCMLVRPKQSQGHYSTRDRLGNEELSFVNEFSYLGHVMTADCRDDKDINWKTIQDAKCSWEYAGQEVLICTSGGKNPIVQVVLYPIYGWALWRHSYRYSYHKLTAIYTVTFKPLIHVSRYTGSCLEFPMITTDHINAVFR